MADKSKQVEEKAKPEYFTLEQVRNLIASVSDTRDKLMLRTIYETGCTPAEIVRIEVGDISGNNIRIKNLDSHELRFPKISGKLAKDISLFIEGNKLHGNLFSTRQSQKMSEKRVRQLIQAYTKKTGISLNPIMFRYYHVAHAYSSGVFIEEISKQLGLTKLRIFQILQEFGVSPKSNNYQNFLGKVG
jgi:site-specific recombinase XerD